MSDMLVGNTEIESDDTQEVKIYDAVRVVNGMQVFREEGKLYALRPLVASDMGAICKIITAIGVRQFKGCFKVEDFQKGNAEQVGFDVVFDIAGIIISNIPKAEEEIQEFLASLTGMKVAEIKQMPFADYGELIIEVVTKDDFKDFFKRVMKLFNQ